MKTRTRPGFWSAYHHHGQLRALGGVVTGSAARAYPLFVGNPTNGPRVKGIGRGTGGGEAVHACCGCFGRPCIQGRRPHVDNCRRGSNSRPHRLLDPSSCDPALLRNPSLSKAKHVQSRSRQTRLALSNWAKPQGSVRRPLHSHPPASRGARQATRNAKITAAIALGFRPPPARGRARPSRQTTTGGL
jgi:hypothetical protein